jgi:hypothetical protein
MARKRKRKRTKVSKRRRQYRREAWLTNYIAGSPLVTLSAKRAAPRRRRLKYKRKRKLTKAQRTRLALVIRRLQKRYGYAKRR